MNCSYGPYKITTSLELVGDNMFKDNQSARRVVVFSECGSTSLPCADAVMLHRENNCPDCDILWYECPSDMGRIYTLIGTPCGVTITSFEDGLIVSGSCDATKFGSEHFCFGKVYSSTGSFESPDKSSVTFTFEGQTFTVQGNLGFCLPGLFECGECQSGDDFEALAELPTPPENVSDPTAPEEGEDSPSEDDTPPTQIIPIEGRPRWEDWSGTTDFGVDTLCEEEKPLTDRPGGMGLPVCESNDNPSVASLPSGHTIVAYENRSEEGTTKISLAILSSSVHMDVRYHRRLSKGTLLNNLAETGGVGHFEIYDEVLVTTNAAGKPDPSLNTQIGFLTGPMAGSVKPVDKFSRSVDNGRVIITFNFSTQGQDVSFPDKNDVHDIQWFLLDEQGSEDLPPPYNGSNAENVITMITLPDHLDSAGLAAPVANPSIAVAANNAMVQTEQVIFVTYQAYESNEWRVYLREIVLGAESEAPPTYVAPYLFGDSQRSIEIMSAQNESAQVFVLGDHIWDDYFSRFIGDFSMRIGYEGRGNIWSEAIDQDQLHGNRCPAWSIWNNAGSFIELSETNIYLCRGVDLPPALQSCSENPPGGRTTCIGVWGHRSASEPAANRCLLGSQPGDSLDSIPRYNKTLAQRVAIDFTNDESPTYNFATTLRFAIISTNDPFLVFDMPEVWFWWGRSDPFVSVHTGQWRLQILRGKSNIQTGAGVSRSKMGASDSAVKTCNCTRGACGTEPCFVFRLYDKFARPSAELYHVNETVDATGDSTESPLREKYVCAAAGDPDYVTDIEWNEWRVESYLRGRKRHFDIYLKNSTANDVLMAQFSEWDPLLFGEIDSTTQYEWGDYHGFGFAHGNSDHQIAVDRVQTDVLLSPKVDANRQVEGYHVFYEDDLAQDGWMNKLSDHAARLSSPFIVTNTLRPGASHHLLNFSNETFWSPDTFHLTAWTYTYMAYHVGFGDTFYSQDVPGAEAGLRNRVEPPPLGSLAGLQPLPGTLGLWSLTMINAPTYDLEGAEQTNNVSMMLSVARDERSHNGAYPHVWFVMRKHAKDNKWGNGYRIRITKFTTTFSSLTATMPNGATRPAFSIGESFWKLSLYRPDFSVSRFTNYIDPADEEVYIKIVALPLLGETDIDWVDPVEVRGSAAKTWPYFKVDVSVVGESLQFKIYVGHDTGGDPEGDPVKFDEIQYELLYTFNTTEPSGGVLQPPKGTEAPWYGFALFSGSKEDPELDDNDYFATPVLNYVKLETLSPVIISPRGACCRSVGGCVNDVTSANCSPPNVWIEGETCWDGSTGFDCTTEIPVGAACKDSGATNCLDNVTEGEATLQGFSGWIADIDCDTRACDPIITTGSCCVSSGCIEDQTWEQCKEYFGINDPLLYWREGFSCPPSGPSCGSIALLGACCLPQGCALQSETDCSGQGGTWSGVGTNCNQGLCVGACCDGTTCTQETQSDCDAGGRTFLGYGVSCIPSNPCLSPDPTGACCFPDGSCSIIIESACNGTYLGYDTVCDDCPIALPTGACCSRDGTCENDVERNTCEQQVGGTYQGDGSTCPLVSCLQATGACCINLVCQEGLNIGECSNAGGTYFGDHTNCISDICTSDLDLGDSPYATTDIVFKPEDLWRIEISDDQYITRVKYHMQEATLVSSAQLNEEGGSSGGNLIDFMFVVDYSSSMNCNPADNSEGSTECTIPFIIENVKLAIPTLVNDIIAKGFDARFGLVIFGRGNNATPVASSYLSCGNSRVFDGLQNSTVCSSGDVLDGDVIDGFTRSGSYLQRALDCWGTHRGATSPWATINFALKSPSFEWRDHASKFIFFVSDTHDENQCDQLGETSYVNDKTTAKNLLIENSVVFIPSINKEEDLAVYQDIAVDSGWTGEIFDIVTADYGAIFESVIATIDTAIRVDHATIMERAQSGTESTHIKNAEVIITYDGDLTDLWTFNKPDFEFSDDHVPFPGTATKGLVNFPFGLASGTTYGIDPVHIQGAPDNWVSFGASGPLNYEYPDGVGHRASSIATDPLLISNNSTRPKVFVNNRNQVIVAYENYSSGTPQIEIKGTGDFHQDSITGAKASRIQRFLTPSDFAYTHAITLPGEGVNQICDFVVDNSDVTHIVWQSSRDNYWEIYYANSFDLFAPVRITKSDSRSAQPSISVDDTGSIFVVYHDDRFGPFNVMLASKDEERIIPLLEQDAYMASLRNKYAHYTNVLPVFIDNPATPVPLLGKFWGSKSESGAGNDSESFVYEFDETTGTPRNGVEITHPLGYIAIGFSSTGLWGITEAGELYKAGGTTESEVVVDPVLKGSIELDISDSDDPWINSSIADMDVDAFGRIWILIYEEAGGIGIGSLAIGRRFRIIRVSEINASTLSFAGVLEDAPEDAIGAALAITDDKFYVSWQDQPGTYFLGSSSYPVFSGAESEFDFGSGNIGAISIDPIESMTADATGTLWAVTTTNDLYTLSTSDASATFQTSLTAESGADAVLPIGTTTGIAFQPTQNVDVGEDQYFHIRIDFYNNIALEGNPFLSVDSRDNLDAFINDEMLSDPYFVQGLTSRGIFIPLGTIGVVFFDATLFAPGFNHLAQPFSFEPNQTYFPRVFAINETGNPRESGIAQTNSFSCSKCSRFGNNNLNSHVCAYSFVAQNNSSEVKYYNFQIDFYADVGKRHLIRRFEATPGNEDLQYIEVDNVPATDLWTEFGLPVEGGSAPFVQVHPVLDPQAGFLCGVLYTVQVNQCFASTEECSEFSILSADNWVSVLVGDTLQSVSLELPDPEGFITYGLSMASIGENLGIAWVSSDDFNIMYAEFDGDDWVTQVVAPNGTAAYVSLTTIQDKPALHLSLYFDNVKVGFVGVFDGSKWNAFSEHTNTRTSGDSPNPKTLLEYDDGPLLTYIARQDGQASFRIPSKAVVFDTNSSCNPGSCLTDSATINGLPALVYTALSAVFYAEWDEELEEFNNIQQVSGNAVYFGHMGIAEINGQPAVAFIKVEGNLGRLIYSRFNGSSWQETAVTAPMDFNKHVAMTNINDEPAIVYSVKQSATTSQLRFATFNGSFFTNDMVDEGINVVDPMVDIAEFQNAPVITISANPFKVYFFRQQSTTSIREVQPVFFCECASKVFTNRLTHLHEVARWESSAHGFSDTRVTDSVENSLRPVIKTRTSNAAVILWEDNNITEHCSSPPCIRAATFRNVNQDQLRGSGTGSWFDYDFGISGQDPSMALDLYDRVNTVYEKAKPADFTTGYHGKKVSKDELPSNELYRKVCDFALDAELQSPSKDAEKECDISSLETNVITFDQFVSNQIVRKIRVKDEFVSYYTYNVAGVLTPIVSSCDIALEIHGTPEIVALRFKNEDSAVFSSWCAWSPQISDFVMEKKHKISNGSGVKEVCIQAMTYSGITTEFCIPIVADYETIVFESKFFKDTPEVASFKTVQEIDGEFFFPADLDEILVELPLSEGISVANLAPTTEENLPIQAKILVEIVPNKAFSKSVITFDVVQQGSNDTLGLIAQRGKNNDGRVVYRGDFVVEREDNVFNIDGLARVNPSFPGSCESQSSGSEISDQFTRDEFNIMGEDLTVETTETTDVLSEFRQADSGRVGVTVDMRSSQDPYFVFGDPNYSLKQSEGRRPGVPFEVVKTDVSVGDPVEQEFTFCPPPDPSDPNLGCDEGFTWSDCCCRNKNGDCDTAG